MQRDTPPVQVVIVLTQKDTIPKQLVDIPMQRALTLRRLVQRVTQKEIKQLLKTKIPTQKEIIPTQKEVHPMQKAWPRGLGAFHIQRLLVGMALMQRVVVP
jgi:hypothetical protein